MGAGVLILAEGGCRGYVSWFQMTPDGSNGPSSGHSWTLQPRLWCLKENMFKKWLNAEQQRGEIGWKGGETALQTPRSKKKEGRYCATRQSRKSSGPHVWDYNGACLSCKTAVLPKLEQGKNIESKKFLVWKGHCSNLSPKDTFLSTELLNIVSKLTSRKNKVSMRRKEQKRRTVLNWPQLPYPITLWHAGWRVRRLRS